MLIALRTIGNVLVRASAVTNVAGLFVCPQCHKEVEVCQSGADIFHFVHKASVPCSYDAGESEAHRRAKSEIFEALVKHPDVNEVTLEQPLDTVRPDVFAYIRGVPVAIEMQISNLSVETIAHRTEEYTRLGIYVLWLLHWTPTLNSKRYSPRRFERWLHTTYFGRVYFWRQDLDILPYHFHEQHTEVPQRFWQDERGRSRSAHGYRRRSRRYKLPICGRRLHLVRDFRKTTRLPWNGPTLSVPKANLWMDEGRGFMPE
jgi:competence protein CoiA